jgi:hypothetical protein
MRSNLHLSLGNSEHISKVRFQSVPNVVKGADRVLLRVTSVAMTIFSDAKEAVRNREQCGCS